MCCAYVPPATCSMKCHMWCNLVWSIVAVFDFTLYFFWLLADWICCVVQQSKWHFPLASTSVATLVTLRLAIVSKPSRTGVPTSNGMNLHSQKLWAFKHWLIENSCSLWILYLLPCFQQISPISWKFTGCSVRYNINVFIVYNALFGSVTSPCSSQGLSSMQDWGNPRSPTNGNFCIKRRSLFHSEISSHNGNRNKQCHSCENWWHVSDDDVVHWWWQSWFHFFLLWIGAECCPLIWI